MSPLTQAEFFYPLVGFDTPESPWQTGPTQLRRFSLAEWRDWEKPSIFTEKLEPWHSYEVMGQLEVDDMPFRPIGLYLVDDAATHEDFLDVWAEADLLALDFVLALRLHGPGNFADPALTCIYTRWGIQNSRKVGPYRMGMYGLPIDNPYILLEEDRPDVEELAEMLTQNRSHGPNVSLDAALENFHLSFGLHLDVHSRLALLFAALEAVVGRTSNVVDGVGFIQRATAAARLGYANEVAVRGFESADIVSLRNRVAHAGPSALPSTAASDREQLEEVTRGVLRGYLAYSLVAPVRRAVMTSFNSKLATLA